MALFEKLRHARKRAREAKKDAPPRVTIADLAVRLGAVREAAAAPEDAMEPALQTVVEATGATAGAICLYDVRQCILRLTTEVGLSDDGCKHLQTVRRADPGCWDMPLHGLLNRRAYLIESANRNRYVPHLVDKGTNVTTVICIPLFAGMTPLASLLLVSSAPRVFSQRDIEVLWEPLRELTAIISQVRRQAAVVAPSGDVIIGEPAQIERTALAADRDRLLSELAARRTEGTELASALEEQVTATASLRAELEQLLSERAHLKEELERRPVLPGGDDVLLERITALEAERSTLRDSLKTADEARSDVEQREAALETARAEAEKSAGEARESERQAREQGAQHERDGGRARADLEAEVERLTERVRVLDVERSGFEDERNERDQLRTELEAAHAREADLRDALGTAERERESGTADETAQALEAARTADAAREEAQRTATALRDEAAALQERVAEVERQVEDSHAVAEGLRSELSDAGNERERLEAKLEEMRGQHGDVSARLGKFDDELTLVRSERDQARQSEQARTAEAAELREALEALTSEHAAANERVAALEGLEANLESEVQRRTEIEQALAGEREGRAKLEAEKTALRVQIDGAAAADQEREAAAQTLRIEIETLRENCERLEREKSDLGTAHEVAVDRLADLETTPHGTVAMGAEAMPDPTADVDDAVTVISVPPEPLEPMVEPGEAPLLVMLDADERWKDIDVAGYRVYVAAPDTDAAAAIAALDPARVVANLGAGVLNTLGALRKAGCTAHFWGCVADPDNDRALSLGMIEPVIPPLEPEVIMSKLGPFAQRGSRLVTVGADVDALMSLRQALTRRRVSVSMAWDAKQAMDLIQQAAPDAMVVDLDLPKQDGYAIVARGIAPLDPAPYTLLVGGRASSGDAFKKTLSALEGDEGFVTLSELLVNVAAYDVDAIGPSKKEKKAVAGFGKGSKS